jgi:hypothetical protein
MTLTSTLRNFYVCINYLYFGLVSFFCCVAAPPRDSDPQELFLGPKKYSLS